MNVKRIIWMGCVGVLSLTGVEAQPRLTLTLSECRSMALSHSEDLQQADNKLQQAALDRKIATTNYLPKFAGSATGAYGRNRP